MEQPQDEEGEGETGTIYQAHEHRDGEELMENLSQRVVPSFDTSTGEEVSVPAGSVVPAPEEHPMYFLQWIRIGGSEILLFFYKGADIAEREVFPIVSRNPGKLRVGGGLEIDTVFGVYKVSLGPSITGEYFEKICRGLPVLTEKFSEHSLEDLNEEVYRLGVLPRDVPLSKVLGGDTVGLLMEITNTKTDPVLIHTLP